MSALPAPPQTTKVLDSDGNKQAVKGTSLSEMMVSDMDTKQLLQMILRELQIIRKHLEIANDCQILNIV